MAFPTTHWSLLAAATIHGDPAGREALNDLCRLYRAPVLAYFRAHCSPEDAADLTQALFLHLLRDRLWRRADPGRGRFRSFLLGLAHNTLRHWKRTTTTAKRGHGTPIVSLDLLAETATEPSAPDHTTSLTFDRHWAHTVLANAWHRLHLEAQKDEASRAQFDILRRFLPGAHSPPTTDEAAALLHTTPQNIRVLVHRFRSHFASALHSEVAATVSHPDEIDAEWQHLRDVMSARHDLAAIAAQPFL